MKKTKKAKAAKKRTLLGGATKSLKKLGKGTANGIGGLSTTKKIVGGAALLALGWNYLSKRRNKKTTNANATAAEMHLNAMDGNEENQA
ncbi:hypothetical protein AUC43_08515 [Hymenobacter sedentarius]|uniref:Uncharacterized protein n=1 Tax=Hymenobacter sedentarius TaxID=1411621 RepID=A0A0U4BMZ0_9BACT|nr:hypothetical protein [Hymenobacter sedentarius]ALW85130.1 hypothetical protein AUC43_08515 [Hymenobacter sedentarius]